MYGFFIHSCPTQASEHWTHQECFFIKILIISFFFFRGIISDIFARCLVVLIILFYSADLRFILGKAFDTSPDRSRGLGLIF